MIKKLLKLYKEPEIGVSELRAFLLQYITEKEVKQNSTDKLINSF